MATSGKRLTRKELRRPDWFQTTTENAFELYEANRAKILFGGAAVIALLLAIWSWQMFKERQDAIAAQEFGQATALYHAGKYREALSAFEKIKAYRWSRYANLSHLYEAHSYAALNDLTKAASAAQRFVVGTEQNSLMRQIGLLTLASVEERKSLCKEAIGHYSEAEKIKSAFTEGAFLGRARCSVQTGDIKGAIAAYQQFLKDQQSSSVNAYLRLLIAELESKLATAPSQK